MLNLSKVQEYRKIPGKNEVRLVGENPYIRFINRDAGGPVYLQGGIFYNEGGGIARIEPWIIEAVLKVSIDKLKKCGLDIDEFRRVHNIESQVPTKEPSEQPVEVEEEEIKEDEAPSAPPRRRR